MIVNELKNILEKHEKWLKGNPDGERADLSGASLRGANLSDTNFCRANLRDTDLWGANLRGANFHEADLCRANLRDTDFTGANLRGANFHEADLCRSNLRDTDLWGANLRDADLRRVDLRDADLHDANLCGADLDYSAWPLWCGSFDIKVDKRMSAQLAYHFCRLDCDDPEHQEAKKSLSKLANQFHRVDECGEVTPPETCGLCGDTTFEGRYGLIASLQAVAEDQRNFCPNCGRKIEPAKEATND